MNTPTIQLWDTVGLGIIITFPTGVMVSNQTGGTACLHPKIEGIYIPLANDYVVATKAFTSPEQELSAYFSGIKYAGFGATDGIDTEDVHKINAILKAYKLDAFIEIDLNKLAESHEAWILIKIHKDENNSLIQGFEKYPLTGILTWSNSD